MESWTRTTVLAALLAGAAPGQVTQLVSIGSNGLPIASWPGQPALSADGRYVAFANGGVYVRDRATGTTWYAGGVASFDPSISADGRCVVCTDGFFPSSIVFAFDHVTGESEIISVDSVGNLANGGSGDADISADGRFVAFDSVATNLDPADTNGASDIFVRDRRLGTTERISFTSLGQQANGPSYCPAISADGRFVAFMSYATNMVPGDTNEDPDIFLRDRQLGTTEVISGGEPGQPNWDTVFHAPSISADGRFVAFEWSYCDMCGGYNVFLRDRRLGVTELVSVNSAGQSASDSSYNPYITPDGRYVVFDSDAANLAQPDSYGTTDVFVRDLWKHTTERVSVDWTGRPGDSASGNFFSSPRDRMSADGRLVGFVSFCTDLVPTGANSSGSAYVRDRAHNDHPTLCSPGFSGTIDCPCSNAPSSRDRGCDNSAGSGGAKLEIGGGEYLSSDSLFFTVTDATPKALTLLFQAFRPNSGGAVLGQGVRCAGGQFTNLYARTTDQNGSVIVPDFDHGDPTVHARAAAEGDPIPTMHTRCYMALYRDPVVLGGCPATSTFNTTPTREVLWLP